MSENTKPNCYDCKHRRELAGNAHSRCAHPSIPSNPTHDLLAAMGMGIMDLPTSEAAVKLNVKGHATGIRRGWFHWPFNFDPRWLQSCDGFEPKRPVTSATGDRGESNPQSGGQT